MHTLGAQLFVVAAPRGRTQPQVPIGPLGHVLLGQVADHRRSAHSHTHRLHLADPAIANQFDGRAKPSVEFGSLLAAGLKHDPMLLHFVDQMASFADRVRQRLLAIDILLGPGCQDRSGHVPMVGRSDQHGRRCRREPTVRESRRRRRSLCTYRSNLGIPLVDLILAVRGPLLDHVAHGHNLHVAVAQKPSTWPRPIVPTPIMPSVNRSLALARPWASERRIVGPAKVASAEVCKKRRRVVVMVVRGW